jgi:hypothetical protein
MRQQLFEIAVSARLFIEPIWDEWHRAQGIRPAIPMQNTCGRTSLFLVEALRHEGISAAWVSGVPRLSEQGPEIGPYGFCSGNRWDSHAWVTCNAWIVDITADQFGADAVIVASASDGRYSPGERDTALPVHISRRRNAVDELWPRWLAYRDEILATRR